MPRLFQKGVSGNPSGRPKVFGNLTELARKHTKLAIDTLVSIAANGKQEAARVAASNAIIDRGYGKPPQFSTNDASQFRKAMEMSDDELATIAARGSNGAAKETPDKAKLLKLVPIQTGTDAATG